MVEAINTKVSVDSRQKLYLEQRLEEIEDKQGFLGQFCNGVKEFTNLGVSASDCESMLEDFKKGKITFEEAVNYIEKYENKQDNMTGLLSNVLTGIGAITATIAAMGTGPIGWGVAIAQGAPIGAFLKTSINTLDRATNDIKGDTLSAKTIAKDVISGAMTGATSAVSSGVGIGIRSGKALTSIVNGAKCGAICGSASGAASYLTDVAFDDDKFSFGKLTTNTLLSGATSATVGAVVGGAMYGGASILGTAGQQVSKSTATVVAQDCTSSSIRKGLGMELKEHIQAA